MSLFPELFGGRGKSFHFSCWCVRCQAAALPCCVSGLPSALLCLPAKQRDVSGAFLGADLPDVANHMCLVSPGTLQPLGWPGSQSLLAQGGWRRQLGEAGARRTSLCSALLPRRFPSLSSSLKSKHKTQRQPLPRALPARCPAAATSPCCSLRCSVPLRSSVRTPGRAAAPRCRGSPPAAPRCWCSAGCQAGAGRPFAGVGRTSSVLGKQSSTTRAACPQGPLAAGTGTASIPLAPRGPPHLLRGCWGNQLVRRFPSPPPR